MLFEKIHSEKKPTIKESSCEELIFICFFVLILYVPVNNFVGPVLGPKKFAKVRQRVNNENIRYSKVEYQVLVKVETTFSVHLVEHEAIEIYSRK